MRTYRTLLKSVLFSTSLLLFGASASFAGVHVGIGVSLPVFGYSYGADYAPYPPPAVDDDAYDVPPCPGPDYVWQAGYYAWRPAYGYVWVGGRWALPPFAGAYWAGPRWEFRGGRSFFVAGGWQHRDVGRRFDGRYYGSYDGRYAQHYDGRYAPRYDGRFDGRYDRRFDGRTGGRYESRVEPRRDYSQRRDAERGYAHRDVRGSDHRGSDHNRRH